MIELKSRKTEVYNGLCKLENDCKKLLKKIPELKRRILKVSTLEEAEQFDKLLDNLGEDLEILEL